MQEPIYEFVKGQGWVVNVPCKAKDRRGRTWTLELRKPESDEHWCWGTFPESTTLKGWVDWLAKGSIPLRYEELYGDLSLKDVNWCTFILVEQ